VTDQEILQAIRRLRAVQRGEVFETVACRVALTEAKAIEDKLAKRYERMWKLRRLAQEQFVAGWPDVSPWQE
jgi:hypothetical protein